MATKTKSQTVPVHVATYAEAWRTAKLAEERKKASYDAMRATVAVEPVTYTFADGMRVTFSATVQNRTVARDNAFALAKDLGVKPGVLARMATIDTRKARALVESGLLTEEQFRALTEPLEVPQIGSKVLKN